MSKTIQRQFRGTIDLPSFNYFFSNRTTKWQIFFNLIAVLFAVVDTAINDLIERLIHSLMVAIGELAQAFENYLILKRGYA